MRVQLCTWGRHSELQFALPSVPCPCLALTPALHCPDSMQRLPRGVVLQHRLLSRRLAGGAPARVQGAGPGACCSQGAEAGGGGGSQPGRAGSGVSRARFSAT